MLKFSLVTPLLSSALALLPGAVFAQLEPLAIPVQPEQVEITDTRTLSLAEALAIAQQNNETLQVAQLELQRAEAALRAAEAALYPTLDAAAGLQSTNSAGGQQGLDTTQTSADGSLQLRYDLGVSGERGARIEAARQSVRLAQLEVEQVAQQLQLDATQDYYALQEADEQIAIDQSFLEEAERNLRDTQLREQVGLGTRFDVLRAQVQVANARQQRVQSVSQQQTAQRQLAARLNVEPTVTLQAVEATLVTDWPLGLEESIVTAFQQRAELEQLLVQRQISGQQRQIALAAVRPELSLVASYTLLQGLSSNFDSLDDGFSLGAELRWRLFDGGAAAATAQQSERDIDIAEQQFSSTRNAIRLEVEQAFFALEANRTNVETAELAVEQAQEALQLAILRFNAGVGTQLDVLTATSELAAAQGNRVTAILEYNRAVAALYRATGAGIAVD